MPLRKPCGLLLFGNKDIIAYLCKQFLFKFKVSTCCILHADVMGKYSDGDMINRFLMTKLKKKNIYGLLMAVLLSFLLLEYKFLPQHV